MKKYIKSLSRQPFFLDVATVATGTLLSQLVILGFSPIITRLYGPEVFGIQSIFFSLVSLLSIVAALGYPTAIVLPKLDAHAIGIARLSMVIAFFTSFIVSLTLSFSPNFFLKMIHAEAIQQFIYLIPLAMFSSAFSDVVGSWMNRKKAFYLTAKYSVASALLVNSFKTYFGFFQPTAFALILTNVIGGILGAILTYWSWFRKSRKLVDYKVTLNDDISIVSLAKVYRDFPFLRTPQNLINAFSQSLPVLLLGAFFGPKVAGQYAVAIAALGMPASLIGGSVMSVFYPRINEAFHNGEKVKSLIVRATFGMAATGLLPFILVIFVGPLLFGVVFGAEWQKAGIYAQWLSPWIFFQYINKPAVSAIPALGLQAGLLIYEIFSTGSKLVALWFGFVFLKNDVAAIAIFSICGVIAYFWLIIWVIKQSDKPKNVRNM